MIGALGSEIEIFIANPFFDEDEVARQAIEQLTEVFRSYPV